MKFLVIQHLVVEGFGIFNQLCRKAGIDLDVVQIENGDALPDLAPYAALWVMGGPMNVDQEAQYPWLVQEKALIRQAVALRKPYLGICLGAQLLADALGGDVGAMSAAEVGVLPITLTPKGWDHPLLRGLALTTPVLQWHGYEIKRLPDQSTLLASSKACPVQGFAIEDFAFGLQFHPEVTALVMESWLSVPEYAAELREKLGSTACEDLQAAVVAHLPTFETNARLLFENFLAIVRSSQQSPSFASLS
ncbi:MAG: type 1 glutamine amidotransferase [Cyanobacteria bacterium Co-bin13]|nr:type 1 glutamine amidotransferase [Cyanobacteria bacterium Co-bin13]